jgi:hypothetical protein
MSLVTMFGLCAAAATDASELSDVVSESELESESEVVLTYCRIRAYFSMSCQ